MKHIQIDIPAASVVVGELQEFPLVGTNREVRIRNLRAVSASAASQTVGIANKVGGVLAEHFTVTGAGVLGYTPGAYGTEDHTVVGSLVNAIGDSDAPLVVYYIAHSGEVTEDIRIDLVVEDRGI